MKIAGIVLIIAGILMMVFKGFNVTHKEKIVDLGPLEVNKQENERVGLPIYVGAAVTVAGALLILAAGRKKQ